MFCFQVKRKLYDFLEGNLSESAAGNIQTHLKNCSRCARELRQTKQLLGLAAQKKPPLPSQKFWQNFDEGLKERIGEEKTSYPIKTLQLRPAFALAGAVVVIMIALTLYTAGTFAPKEALLTQLEEQLISEGELLEEVGEEIVLLDDEESLIEEIDLLEDMS